jgi:hypothetical protein
MKFSESAFWQFIAELGKPRPMIRHLAALSFVCVAWIALAPCSARAEDLGSSGDWLARTHSDGAQKLCYAISAPQKSNAAIAGRGPVGVLVTHLEGGGAKNQISAALGYRPKSGTLVRLIVDGKPYILRKVDGDRAWARDGAADDLILRAMRKGNRMLLTGVTEDGEEVEDTFSLSGLSKSVKMAAGACGVE